MSTILAVPYIQICPVFLGLPRTFFSLNQTKSNQPRGAAIITKAVRFNPLTRYRPGNPVKHPSFHSCFTWHLGETRTLFNERIKTNLFGDSPADNAQSCTAILIKSIVISVPTGMTRETSFVTLLR